MGKKSGNELIKAIQSASKSMGKGVLTQKEFFNNTDFTISDVHRNGYAKWSEACEAAGVGYDRSRDWIPDEELLSDWGFVTRDLRHTPSLNEYRVNGKFSRKPFNRFGLWINIPEEFSKSFVGSSEWDDVLAICQNSSPKKKIQKITNIAKTGNQKINFPSHEKFVGRPIYGDPVDFRGLRNEPVNEQGVVFLFGMVARELGYLVEAVQGSFPDCEAKRKVARGWQPVRIEFEYESKNFSEHAHDPQKCDVIVCWKHNWKECPENLEIIELSKAIKNLPKNPIIS